MLDKVNSKLQCLSFQCWIICSAIQPHQPFVTAESSQTGDPWPAGRVRGGEEWLLGNNPASGAGGSVTAQPAGAYGAPGAPWLQLQQPGPLEERSCLGRRRRHLEAAGCDGAENNTAFGYLERRQCRSLLVFSESVSLCVFFDMILLSFFLIAVAPKLSARRGSAADPGEPLMVCLCSMHHLLLTHTVTAVPRA